ncbi:hypothetical protein [Candidatus Albibeggiatoa sp. nov. BB20]|uniref:helix-turn-helix domain-containing protein n=1 Tax=Candidatus Albibeggiatoa sp. nov. BB20 TaxID=3162723 RepID=UPI00336592BC
MFTIGERLKKERLRLKLSQIKLANIGEVTRQSQINYESDKRSPDAEYLSKVGMAGVNVNYVLLGDSKEVSSDDYEDEFLETVELRVKQCKEHLGRFESNLEDIQNALSVVKKK